MNAEFDPVEADPAEPSVEPCAVLSAEAVGPAHPPADLVDLYRELMLARQEYWMGEMTGHWGDAMDGIGRASRQIREHTYWRTLTEPAEVARAARALRDLGTYDPEDGSVIQPFRPVAMEVDLTFRSGPKDPQVRRDLARELDEAGLWDTLSDADHRAERAFVEQTGCFLRFGLVYRDRHFFADAERMFELGALSQLDEMAPALAAAGVALDVVPISDPYRPPPPGGEDYILEINGLLCPVWTAQETEQSDLPLWFESMIRPFIVINELLDAAGSRERLYLDPSGDSVYLLPQQVRAVLIKEVYEGYGERSLMLADRSVWDRPAWC